MTGLMLLAALAAQDNAFAVGGTIAGLSEAERRLMYYGYGDCVVSRFRKQAVAAILADIDDETLMKRSSPLPATDCLKPPKMMSVWMALPADRVRYAVADALVRTELAGRAAPNLLTVPQLSHLGVGEPPSASTGKPSEKEFRAFRERYLFSQFSRFGECVVRTNPVASRELLLTLPETADEKAAFAKIHPAMANCLVPGQTIKLTKLPLRGTIAVNYYRLAKAAAAATAGLAK